MNSVIAPTGAARGLITGRTGNIGLIVTDLSNPFFPEVVEGVQGLARESDLSVLPADPGEMRRSRPAANKCVDISGWNAANGAPLVQWQCSGGANQKWRTG